MKEAALTIGIISALPQEQVSLLTKIEDRKQLTPTVIKGRIGNHTVIVTLSGMGKVNASSTAQMLISQYNIDAILFSGVAGGLNPDYKVGDVVIASKAFQHDFGYAGESFVMRAVGHLPEIGLGSESADPNIDLSQFWTKKALDNIKQHASICSESFSAVEVNNQHYHPKLFLNGTDATGDVFVANGELKSKLQELGGDLVEMEGGAVAQVALNNKVPCMIIRAISDAADQQAEINFQTFFEQVASNNATLVAELVNSINYPIK
ncbi:5'-methylthioadenosine/adenosylhomocysteine nucleosidase [Vibrio marisflavi]|uniref:5'-methylthioadenosine/S-adenosylhomocysteine nucleosidase n=1 Tax=Vibrio marisflavi CECT 7928 TaxID=634439 RepID=A0ABM8ZYU9_9VIBR|nr:5'-methylthioadenosine/adenosylhomocysteine nucleosidase [Vibrio marisflavi]CAH0536113.1 5'-methylthioadenosine/S-adenosylhomocysteine nucleosidase [Vibrio marisflavi CECT 7928]